MQDTDKASWLMLPVHHSGEKTASGERGMQSMLDELGLQAPEPMAQTRASEQLSAADRYLLRLPVETNPFAQPADMNDIFANSGSDTPRQGWFVRIDDVLPPSVDLEMEMATDRSGARRNDRRGIFWLVGGGERVVYAWDGEQILQAQPVAMDDGGSLVYDPENDNLFVVSDAEEQLYVFTMGGKARKKD